MNTNAATTKPAGLPPKQGLYDPRFEHDACGMGVVVNIDGKKDHRIVEQALTVLTNLTHRGARGSEPNSGDGAGIMIQIPHKFFQKKADKKGFKLPEPGEYGVGVIFMPPDVAHQRAIEIHFEKIVAAEGQKVLGWLSMSTDNSDLGETAKRSEPRQRQVFIARNPKITDPMEFERKLYVIRKRAENEIRYGSNLTSGEYFYVSSLSYKTIIYKGQFVSDQVTGYFTDLADPDVESALALVHSRFSTNTFPSWERAHPYRYIIHNGEINTLRGNINWIRAQEKSLESEIFGDDMAKILPIIQPDGSDSAMFDNCLEFLVLAGRPLPHAMMMMIPEPWSRHETMDDDKKAFYEYHAHLMEPWDGPAAMGFTDGTVVGAMLDRNGLRPARYYVTKDNQLILASEVGVLPIAPENIEQLGRLEPGRMLLVDTEQKRIISDQEIKRQIATEHPYRDWLNKYQVRLEDLPQAKADQLPKTDYETIIKRQRAFGYTDEDLRLILAPMAENAIEPIGAMGTDTPLAVFSNKPKLLYNYFKQLFAQVTNPPIDAIREELIIATEVMVGADSDLLKPSPQNCHQLRLDYPILTNEELAQIRSSKIPGFVTTTLPFLYKAGSGAKGMALGMEELYAAADAAIARGINIIVLSDREMDSTHAPIPALLALSGLHHHLVQNGTRTRIGLIVESGEPREVHHFAALIGYGATAVNPYLAYESIDNMILMGQIMTVDREKGYKNYVKAAIKGVVKTLSKMGISTIQSYCGAQIFEAVGIHQSVIDKYFTWTPSRIGGVDLDVIAQEAQMRHEAGFPPYPTNAEQTLVIGGEYQWRKEGEYHLWNPETIYTLQQSCWNGDYSAFKQYSKAINEQDTSLKTIRGLFEFKLANQPLPLEEVEPVEAIVKRFKSGAMSFGSISKEAHETIAIAMNRLGGKSNSGEGGEDPGRFKPLPNGDSKCSAIKQVASGRFGVTSDYLMSAKELQIKLAQGAKPGEGGQLPGRKVYPWVAKERHSTPGVGLISPPPHHDIYSIEDLAELIYDLKNANREARINVKLVSEIGVGTIAAGVAKAHADVVLISGYDGGTGASPVSSIKHTGLPWELGLAETHQTLVLNNLRDRIVVETDGQLKTGRDVVVAALLGAEEYGFATTLLVTMGCVLLRACHLDTCEVGVATQNPELRKNFKGKPEYIINFLTFIAQEMREIMAQLGFRTIDEMVGRSDRLEMREAISHWKAQGLDYSELLYRPDMGDDVPVRCTKKQDHGMEQTLDYQVLLDLAKPALERGEKVSATLPIRSLNRVVGTMLGSEITRKYGAEGLPEDTIQLHFKGSAGQSFAAFVPKGLSMTLEGDSNDYLGKGLSGGKIVVYPMEGTTFVAEENIIVGNVAFYGATYGEAFIRGMAGERFCVRNSGVTAVVEGVGDHGCEYMTGGRVVVLGRTGRNFAAGMSGGVAYVLDEKGSFPIHCNQEMVSLEPVEGKDAEELKALVEKHYTATKSAVAQRLLADWDKSLSKFVKVMPKDYKRMLEAFEEVAAKGLSGEEAIMAAFELNKNDKTRVSGN
ncbi:glutamate synthase large subunit [Holophaga foetida]|uniref:glutamate synthase large subunit n=1 Tax=Holophaga foetida TaxID=35839 RepID=UPI00047E38CC|nr:glutamate synthase large subunit [Holophaga foetida]